MKNLIIVPGRPDEDEYLDMSTPAYSADHWYSWLTKQLQVKDIFSVSIEIPRPFSPRYEVWKKEFERYDTGPETILIGHSCGGGFLVRWLSENKNTKVDKVFLVAPWINPENNPIWDTADFFDVELDPQLTNRANRVVIINSSNDQETIHKSVDIIRSKIPDVEYLEFENKGHFLKEDLGRVDFSELLEEIEK
jgi:uncharacterized protein